MNQDSTVKSDNSALQLLPSLLSALDVVVFERRKFGNFNLLGELPEWFGRLYPNGMEYTQGGRMGQLSPFLENFLIDAEQLWQTHTHRQLSSGAWVEQDTVGNEYSLEACAMFIQNRRILAIRHLGSIFAEKQSLMQRARENSLRYLKMADEMEQKDILLHTIVHDMSGPLAGLKGYLDLLTKEDLSVNGQEFLDICKKQTSRLNKLVHEILDSFSAEMDVHEFQAPTVQDAPDMLATTIDVIKALLSTALLNKINLQLNSEVEHTINWKVKADKSRLERIMFNLIGNALWHSPENGTVLIDLEELDGVIRVSVYDDGPGISDEYVSTIFQKFSQGKNRPGKLGLGLYFCRLTVEHWGGKIGYKSRETGGSNFWFELPKP